MSGPTTVNNNPDASAVLPTKCKRGRPRKHPKVDLYNGETTYDAVRDQFVSRGYNLNGREKYNAQSGGISGNQPRQPNSVNDTMLGQAVHGVIEGVFDAGYLLSVRVGNSDTNLKGVVFKPGHYVPVSAENDIAPGVQMITRNEFPVSIPREDKAQFRRRREKNRTAHGTHVPSAVAPRGDLFMPQTASSGIPRGNVVPVVLQPTGEPPSIAMAPHLAAASKGKAVVGAALPLSGSSSFAQQLAEAEKQAQRHGCESMYQQLLPPKPRSGLIYNGLTEPPATLQTPGMPFEKLLTQVMKRVEKSPENNSDSVGNLKDSRLATGDDEEEEEDEDEYEEEYGDDDDDGDEDDEEDGDSDQPLTVEPLQAIQPNRDIPPAVIQSHMEKYKTGKMTELLQVVQKNIADKSGSAGWDTKSGGVA